MSAGEYAQVGSASDIQNISPYSDQIYNMMNQMLSGNIEGDLVGQWLGQMPGVQNLAVGVNSPYGQARMAQAQDIANQLKSDISGQFADIGALRSSAAAGEIGKAVSSQLLGAQTDIIGKEQGLVGQFGGMMANLMGQGLQARTGLMGQMAGVYGPEYYEPTYAYQPGFLDYFTSLLGAAGQATAGGAAAYNAMKPV